MPTFQYCSRCVFRHDFPLLATVLPTKYWLKQNGALKLAYFLPVLFFIFFALGLTGCLQPSIRPPRDRNAPPPYTVDGKIYYPLGEVGEYVERGIASWYGEKFHGRKTSSGEVYDMYAKTAAHRILPFGTHIEVTNLANGKKTAVRINDRGPFVKGRIIDLSYRGAREIGLVGPGTAPVEIKAIGVEGAQSQHSTSINASALTALRWSGSFTIQIGAFEDLDNALHLKEKVSHHFNPVYITAFEMHGKTLYRVRVGKYPALDETIQVQKKLESRGYQNTFVVAE